MRVLLCTGILITLWVGKAMADDFAACVARLQDAAVAAGVTRTVAAAALDHVQSDASVLALAQIQPEFKMPIWDYLGFLVDQQRIAEGRARMQQHAQILRAAEQHYGVNRYVLTAVWGVETDYGNTTGKHFLPQALATLVCARDRRAGFWRSELIAALQLVARGDLALHQLYGSWAGAFGQTQFLPSTYARLAVDFDGDGRRDLVDSLADALGSTANYLQRAGWRHGEPWMREVQVPAHYKGPTGRTNRTPLSTWATQGVVRADGGVLSGDAPAGLLLPAGPEGPGFLVFRNFDAIYAYNRAESYALAIAHLADRLAGSPALRTPWPTDDPGLSRAECRHLQELLIARGYAIGEADGTIGPATRAAIAEAEKRVGMAAHGPCRAEDLPCLTWRVRRSNGKGNG